MNENLHQQPHPLLQVLMANIPVYLHFCSHSRELDRAERRCRDPPSPAAGIRAVRESLFLSLHSSSLFQNLVAAFVLQWCSIGTIVYRWCNPFLLEQRSPSLTGVVGRVGVLASFPGSPRARVNKRKPGKALERVPASPSVALSNLALLFLRHCSLPNRY